MRMPYRTTLAECREAMRRFLDLCRFETKHGARNDGPGVLAGWIAVILVWAAVIAMLLAMVGALLGPAE
jgi:hypothetical protein